MTTSSFLKLRKPWLQYQSEFEDSPHLADLYNFWSLVWGSDTKDKSDLPYWEYEIRSSSLAYVRTGLSLHIIRSKLAFGNKKWRHLFEDFCKNSPIGSVGYANQIIKAAQVTLDLINRGFKILPSCIAQALPLAKFNSSLSKEHDDNEELSQKWQEVIDSSGGRITAAHVRAVVDDKEKENPLMSVKVGEKFRKAMAEEAKERGISIQEMLEEILAERYQERLDEDATNDLHEDEGSDCGEAVKLTPETEEILNRLDVYFATLKPCDSKADTNKDGSPEPSPIRSDKVSDSS